MMPITFLKIFLHMIYDQVFPKIEKKTIWKHLWSPWTTKWIKKSSKKEKQKLYKKNVYFKKLKRIEKSFNLKISKANMKIVLGIPGKYKYLKEKTILLAICLPLKQN